MSKPLVTSGQEWTNELLEDIYGEIGEIAVHEFGLNTYPSQLEIISSEQMLDAYSSVGLPIYYPHWSFGEQFVKQLEAYRRGHMGLAYEIVINSDPCISYLMEENTMLMQTLVIGHAAFGHNHFFKNNYLFKQWTNANAIIDYLVFAKKYILECEEKYGKREVEAVIDAAHALQHHGIDKYRRPPRLSSEEEKKRQKERDAWYQSQVNEIWNTIPKSQGEALAAEEDEDKFPKEPEENLIYFLEKNTPRLEPWKREVLRIVRKVAQYFYPQSQTKMMNEGCATYFHYKIMHRLYEKEIVDVGAMLEFMQSHTGVVMQPSYDKPYYSGINPYALGFEMMKDIERVATNPTKEDMEWFSGQDWVGQGEPTQAILHAIASFRDESFVRQYLSPQIIRDFRLFAITDDEQDPQLEVAAIHNRRGYKRVRSLLADQYTIGNQVPDIQVVDVDRWGDRSLTLEHQMVNGRPLDAEETTETLDHLAYLWGYAVHLQSTENGNIRASYSKSGEENLLDVFIDD